MYNYVSIECICKCTDYVLFVCMINSETYPTIASHLLCCMSMSKDMHCCFLLPTLLTWYLTTFD